MPDGAPIYRLFLDETIVKSDGEQERTWFALVGCVIRLEEHGRILHAQFEDIKRRLFRHHSERAPVVFHRIEMCCPSPRGAFSILRDEGKRSALYGELLRVVDGCDFRVVLELDEIRGYRERQRTDWRTLGYLGCLGPLVTSYCEYLDGQDVRGDVMASHLGMKENGLLKGEYWKILQVGGYGKYASFFRRRLSRALKIELKEKNVAGLQLADLIAAPIIRKLLSERTGSGHNVERFAREVAEVGGRKRLKRLGQEGSSS